jgi:hypothetical protein
MPGGGFLDLRQGREPLHQRSPEGTGDAPSPAARNDGGRGTRWDGVVREDRWESSRCDTPFTAAYTASGYVPVYTNLAIRQVLSNLRIVVRLPSCRPDRLWSAYNRKKKEAKAHGKDRPGGDFL